MKHSKFKIDLNEKKLKTYVISIDWFSRSKNSTVSQCFNVNDQQQHALVHSVGVLKRLNLLTIIRIFDFYIDFIDNFIEKSTNSKTKST